MANWYKRFFFIWLCFLGTLNVAAQKNTIYKFKAEGLGGIVLNNQGYAFGVEAALELPLYGNRNWEYTYNFPTIGFAAGGFRLPELQYIDPVLYANPYFNYPIIHKQRFMLNTKLGAGIAMMKTENYEAGYIFPVTGLLTGGINTEIVLGKFYGNPRSQWSLTFGVNGKIFHNGNVTKESKNFTIVDGAVGLKYTPNVHPLPIKHPAKPVNKVLALEVCGQGGVNQLSREDRHHFYPNASLNVGFYLPLSNAYRLGLGADAFYNSIYDGKQRIKNTRYNFIKEDKFMNKFRSGVFLANDLTIDRFIAGLHVGVYVLSNIQVPEYSESGEKNGNLTENWLYSKLVMKYKITPNFMVNAQLKSHLLEVECVEVGVGFALPEFSRMVKNPFRNVSLKKKDPKELRID